jgi:hypothetical protein
MTDNYAFLQIHPLFIVAFIIIADERKKGTSRTEVLEG